MTPKWGSRDPKIGVRGTVQTVDGYARARLYHDTPHTIYEVVEIEVYGLNARVCVCACVCAHARVHYARARVYAHTRTCVRAYTRAREHTRARMLCAHAYTRTRVHTHARAFIFTHPRVRESTRGQDHE